MEVVRRSVTMQQHFGDVWFASEERLKSTHKGLVYDDRGVLDVTSEGLLFRGRQHVLPMEEIHRLALARQQLPWLTYAIVLLFLVALSALLLIPPIFMGGAENPILHVTFITACLAFSLLPGVLIAHQTRWIEVEYKNEQGGRTRVYFADGSRNGWGGILGGTSEMYQTLARVIPLSTERES